MSVSTRDKVHNQFCREPDAGKPHVRIYAGVRPVRGVSTHQVQHIFSVWEVLVNPESVKFMIFYNQLAYCKLV